MTFASEESWYHKVYRTDGSEKEYCFLENMLLDFDRDDVLALYRVLLSKYLDKTPIDDYVVLILIMEAMFEPNEKDLICEEHDDQ